MVVDGQRYAPAALPPGNRPVIHCIGGWVGPRACMENLASPPGFVPRTLQPVASRYTDWAIHGLRQIQSWSSGFASSSENWCISADVPCSWPCIGPIPHWRFPTVCLETMPKFWHSFPLEEPGRSNWYSKKWRDQEHWNIRKNFLKRINYVLGVEGSLIWKG
jgi:hypothetical protein